MALSKKELIKSREKKLQLAAPFHRDKQMRLIRRRKKCSYFWATAHYPYSKFMARLSKEELDYLRNGYKLSF
tara:strand:+ start:2020 stop:2235 length:216 start_codon:yes stop_codon:yes gene_type:complete